MAAQGRKPNKTNIISLKRIIFFSNMIKIWSLKLGDNNIGPLRTRFWRIMVCLLGLQKADLYKFVRIQTFTRAGICCINNLKPFHIFPYFLNDPDIA